MADEPGQDESGRPWWERGEEPDYRATMANERTFLSWTRTALALLAAALGSLKFLPDTPFGIRLALAGWLLALSVAATAIGYHQWRSRQQRMRLGAPLGHSAVPALLSLAFLLLTGLVCVAVAYEAR
ncbi:MAG TPA: DUF202 domain-containing protein [Actinocrinis sp.]|nr:DUF202 domain-containing protein [Actinocrinis sp.]